MSKFKVGDEVYLGDSYWCGYTVMKVKTNDVKPDVLISSSGSMLDAFWVSSKELSFIC